MVELISFAMNYTKPFNVAPAFLFFLTLKISFSAIFSQLSYYCTSAWQGKKP